MVGSVHGPDELSFGPSGPPRVRLPGWLRGRRAAAGAVLVVLVALTVVTVIAARGRGHHRPSAAGPVTVIDAGHPLLGVRAGWELFAAGPGMLVRVRFAAGVVIRTALPPLPSTGRVLLLVGPRQAVIWPLDYAPGYLVPDGGPAQRLPAALGRAGMAFPGPRAGQLWVQTGFGTPVAVHLVDFAGRRAGGAVSFPGPWGYQAVPDGHGYFLVQHASAVEDIRPSRLRRVTSGTLDAAGPSAWLVTRCSRARCAYVVVDPASGARRILPGQAPRSAAPVGVISPDGRTAAMLAYGRNQSTTLHLINLVTGADLVVGVGMRSTGPASVAWSPDSRWLFAVTEDGALLALDPHSGRVRSLGVPLPPVSLLAIRAASQPRPDR